MVVVGVPYLLALKQRETRVVVVPSPPSGIKMEGGGGGGGGGFPQPSGIEMGGNGEGGGVVEGLPYLPMSKQRETRVAVPPPPSGVKMGGPSTFRC